MRVSKSGYELYDEPLQLSADSSNEIILNEIETSSAERYKTINVYTPDGLYSGSLTAFFSCSNSSYTNTQNFTGGKLENIVVPDGCGQMSVKIAATTNYEEKTVPLSSSTLTRITLEAKPVPKGNAKITITNKTTDDPVEGIIVYLYKSSNNSIADSKTTNSAGVATVDDITPGTYYFKVTGLANYSGAQTEEFEVTEDNLSVMTLELEPVAAGSKEKLLIKFIDEDDDPIEGVTVNVFDGDSILSGSTGSDEDGIYERENLDSGEYTIIASKPQYVTKVELVSTVPASSDDDVEIVLESADEDNSGTVKVQVIDDTIGVEDVIVFLYAEAYPDFMIASEMTNEDGEAFFRYLEPAVYYASAQVVGASGESEHKGLDAGETVTITINLETDTALLRVKVLKDSDGNYIQGAHVSIINSVDTTQVYANNADTNAQGYTDYFSVPIDVEPYVRAEADGYLSKETTPFTLTLNQQKTVTLSLRSSAGIEDPEDFNIVYLGVYNDEQGNNPATTLNKNTTYFAEFKVVVPASYDDVKAYFAGGDFGSAADSNIIINEIIVSRPTFNITYYDCFSSYYATNCGSALTGSSLQAKLAAVRFFSVSDGEYPLKVKFTIKNSIASGDKVKIQYAAEREDNGQLVKVPSSDRYNAVEWTIGESICSTASCEDPAGSISALLVYDGVTNRAINTTDTFDLNLGSSPPVLEIDINGLNPDMNYTGFKLLVENLSGSGIVKIGDDANIDAQVVNAYGKPPSGKLSFADENAVSIIPQQLTESGIIRIAWLDTTNAMRNKMDFKIRILDPDEDNLNHFSVDIDPSQLVSNQLDQELAITVTDSSTHNAVTGATVKLTSKTTSGVPDFSNILSSWNVTTNSSGIADITNIDTDASGTYYLRVNKSSANYEDFDVEITVYSTLTTFSLSSFDCIEVSPATVTMEKDESSQGTFSVEMVDETGCDKPIEILTEVQSVSSGMLTISQADNPLVLEKGDSESITIKPNGTTLPGEYGIWINAKYEDDPSDTYSFVDEVAVIVRPVEEDCFDVFDKSSPSNYKYSFDIQNKEDEATIVNSCFPTSLDSSYLRNLFLPYAKLTTCDDRLACIKEKNLLGEYGTVSFDWKIMAVEYPEGYDYAESDDPSTPEDDRITGATSVKYSNKTYSADDPSTAEFAGRLENITKDKTSQEIASMQSLIDFGDPAAELISEGMESETRNIAGFIEIDPSSIVTTSANAPSISARFNSSFTAVEAYVLHTNDEASNGTFDITAYNINMPNTRYAKLRLEDYQEPEGETIYQNVLFTLIVYAIDESGNRTGPYQLPSAREILADGKRAIISNSSVDDFPIPLDIKESSEKFEISVVEDSFSPGSYETQNGDVVESGLLLSYSDTASLVKNLLIANEEGNIDDDIYGELTTAGLAIDRDKVDLVVLIDTSGSMDEEWQVFCGPGGVKETIPAAYRALGFNVNFTVYAIGEGRTNASDQCYTGITDWGEGLVGFAPDESKGDQENEAWAPATLWAIENHPWDSDAWRSIIIVGDNDPTGGISGDNGVGIASDFRVGVNGESYITGRAAIKAKERSIHMSFWHGTPFEYTVDNRYGDPGVNDLEELMEYAKEYTEGETVREYNTDMNVDELLIEAETVISSIIIPTTGVKEFHVKLEVKPEDSCITSTGNEGITGSSALNSFKRLFNWGWNSNADRLYFCNDIGMSGEENEGFYVCDSTQFMQEVLNRLLEIREEGLAPSDRDYIELTEFNSWIVADSYTEDFFNDFVVYANDLQGVSTGSSPQGLFTSNSYDMFDLNKYVMQKRIRVKVKCPSGELDNPILDCPLNSTDGNTLPTSGLYSVKISADYDVGRSGQFINPSTGEPTADITIELELLDELTTNNLLYYIPLNGNVGLINEGTEESPVYKFDRKGYGTDFNGDAIDLFIQSSYTTSKFITYPSKSSNAPFKVKVKKITDFKELNGLEQVERKTRGGQLFSIDAADKWNFTITFAPSYATPVLMRQSENKTGTAGAFYAIKQGNKEVSDNSNSAYWAQWTGVASYSTDCIDLQGNSLPYKMSDWEYLLGQVDSSACSIGSYGTDQMFGFSSTTDSVSQKGNEVYYYSVFYSPAEEATTGGYYLQNACNNSESGFRSLVYAGSDYAGRIYLDEIPNSELAPSLGDQVIYADDLFNSLKNEEELLCLATSETAFEITWNEEKIFSIISGEQDFDSKGLTTCYYSTVPS